MSPHPPAPNVLSHNTRIMHTICTCTRGNGLLSAAHTENVRACARRTRKRVKARACASHTHTHRSLKWKCAVSSGKPEPQRRTSATASAFPVREGWGLEVPAKRESRAVERGACGAVPQRCVVRMSHHHAVPNIQVMEKCFACATRVRANTARTRCNSIKKCYQETFTRTAKRRRRDTHLRDVRACEQRTSKCDGIRD